MRCRLALSLLALSACQAPSPHLDVADQERVTYHAGQPVFAQQVVFAGDADVVAAYFAGIAVEARFEPVDEQENIHLVHFADRASLPQVLADLREVTEFATANHVITMDDISQWPQDPEFINLWGFKNYGQTAPGGVEGRRGADMDVLGAWEALKQQGRTGEFLAGTNDEPIVVAVIDTGVDIKHPDLEKNIWKNKKEIEGSEGVDDDGNGYIDDTWGWDFVTAGTENALAGPGDNDPADGNGHGTHCAGTIAAIKDIRGVVGVAPNIQIMPLRFLDDMGSGSSVWAYRAIRYATDNGAHILSNSWGGGAPNPLIKRAIQKARDKGVLFVAAAGNDAGDNDFTDHYPSDYEVENVVSVGASDNNDTPADFSNHGEKSVHVFAPGVNILSTIPTRMASGNRAWTTMSGTSMATPAVAGVAALVLAADAALVGQPEKLRDRLIRSSDPVPALLGKSVSNGRINAARAVTGDVAPIPADVLVEEAHAYSSPRYPHIGVDDRHTIKKAGAKAIRAHIDVAQIDEPYDSVWVYDSQHRLVTQLHASMADTWTPLVPGDTLTFRFVNSRVQQTKSEWKPFDTPDEGFAAGAQICQRIASGWECAIDGETKEFFNFDSEGYTIDRIAFIPGDQE